MISFGFMKSVLQQQRSGSFRDWVGDKCYSEALTSFALTTLQTIFTKMNRYGDGGESKN